MKVLRSNRHSPARGIVTTNQNHAIAARDHRSSNPHVNGISARQATATLLQAVIDLLHTVSIIILNLPMMMIVVVVVPVAGVTSDLAFAPPAAAAGQSSRLVVFIVVRACAAEAALQGRAEVGTEQATGGEDEAATEQDHTQYQRCDVATCSGTQKNIVACSRELGQGVGRLA